VAVGCGERRQSRLPVVIDHKDRPLERMPDDESMLHLHGCLAFRHCRQGVILQLREGIAERLRRWFKWNPVLASIG
jgi:hypothetical protein